MRPAEPHQLDDVGGPGRVDTRHRPLGDRQLLGRRLVRDRQAAHAVVDRTRDAGRADGVERVHRRDQPKARHGGDVPEPRHMELAFAHHRDEHVERLLRHAVDLLDVQQRTLTKRRDERAVDEHVGVVAVDEHPRRVEVTDEAGGRQLGVALDELEADTQLVGDGAQERRLAGARRPFDQHVPVDGERGDDELDLTAPPDETSPEPFDERRHVLHGTRVNHRIRGVARSRRPARTCGCIPGCASMAARVRVPWSAASRADGRVAR